MKALALCLFALAISNEAIAQCEYEQNGIDDMKKVRLVTTIAKTAYSISSGANFSFRAIDTSLVLTITYFDNGVIEDNGEVMFKLDNDSIISLHAEGVTSAVGRPTQFGTNWFLTANYHATRNDFAGLATHNVIKVRYYKVDGYSEYEVAEKPKMQRRIREAAACLIQAVPVRH